MAIPQLLESLYGRSTWKPILAFKLTSGGFLWLPKAYAPSTAPAASQIASLGVWGGCVETYDVGFNQQPCDLVFASIDVDWKHQRLQKQWHYPVFKGGYGYPSVTELTSDLPTACAAIVPGALVRRSSGGYGAHIFLRLSEPIRCANKLAAQALACEIAKPVAARLREHSIEPDIVGHNQLWIWGGQQETINDPKCWIDFDEEKKKELLLASNQVQQVHAASCSEAKGDEINLLEAFGPVSKSILTTLHDFGVIRLHSSGACAQSYNVHIKAVQDALWNGYYRTQRAQVQPPPYYDWLRKITFPHSAGTRLDEHNAILSLSEGQLSLFSFVGHKQLLNIPLGV